MSGSARAYYTLLFSLACTLFLPLAEASTALRLEPFEARFQVSRNDFVLGTMDIRFTLDAKGQYVYSGHTKPGELLGLFISDEVYETSEGSYRDDRIRPDRYHYLQDNGERKKQTDLEFDWSDGQVWTESKGKRWAQALPPETHDKYSQQLALRLDLAKGERQVSYPVADGGKIKTYHYQVVGEAFVELPYGRLKCLQIKRSKEHQAPDYVIWVAPELNYLPVKIERKRSSGDYAIELMRFEPGRSAKP
jgi:hypothetical protein